MRDLARGVRGWTWKGSDLEGVLNPQEVAAALDERLPHSHNSHHQEEIEEWAARIESPDILRACIVETYGINDPYFDHSGESAAQGRRLLRVFGLDVAHAKLSDVVRRAFLQAWIDFWIYSANWLEYQEDQKLATQHAALAAAAIDDLVDGVAGIADIKRRWGGEDERNSVVDPVLLRRQLADQLKEKVIEWGRSFTADNKLKGDQLVLRPDRWLYRRLGEVLSYLTGVAAPLDDNGDRRNLAVGNQPSSAPDQQHLRFVDLLLAIANWPIGLRTGASGGKKDVFRDIVARDPGARENMRYLAGLSRQLQSTYTAQMNNSAPVASGEFYFPTIAFDLGSETDLRDIADLPIPDLDLHGFVELTADEAPEL